MHRLLAAIALGAALAALPARAQPAPQASIRAPRGALEILLPDGRLLAGLALVGVTLDLGPAFGTVRITGVSPDPLDRAGEVLLHDLRWQDPGTGAWDRATCIAAADGTTATVMLELPGGVAPHCTGTNPAKCLRFGYAPWRQAPDGRPLADFHRACLRMLPAEYAGDGRFHTRTGTPIEFHDAAGINGREDAPGLVFEAGWDAAGAVCIAHARVPAVTDTAHLPEAAPHLAAAGRLGPEACTEASALGWGALLFNSSASR